MRIEDIFFEDNIPEFPYEFDFVVEGVTNQRAAVNAGAVNITTYLKYGEDEYYMVDTGITESSFEATTTQIVFKSITVSEPITSGSTSSYEIIFTPEASVPADGYVEISVPS